MRCFYELLCVTEELVSTFESFFFFTSYDSVVFSLFSFIRQFLVSFLSSNHFFFSVCMFTHTEKNFFNAAMRQRRSEKLKCLYFKRTLGRMHFRHTVCLCVCVCARGQPINIQIKYIKLLQSHFLCIIIFHFNRT